jgi:hypothetical protein
MSKTMEFSIDPEGAVKIVKVEGFGSGCLEATKFLERALGGADETTRNLTDEINEPYSVDGLGYIEL